MKYRNSFYTIALSIIFAVSIYTLWEIKRLQKVSMPVVKASTYAKVISSGELRVGYLVLPPYLSKEASNGKLSGVFYEIMQEMGRRLNLKVNWVEEVNLATLSEGIDNSRYDLIAFPLWRSAGRARKVAFSTPLFYSTVGCYARPDDNRFNQNLDAINDPNINVATIDGELAESIAKSDFPKAKLVPLPPLSDYSQMLLQVASKKADVTFHNRVFAKRYMEKNPGTIKEVSREPIRVFAECYVLPITDLMFQNMINQTVLEMVENGIIAKAFKDNGENPEEYYMTSIPYRVR